MEPLVSERGFAMRNVRVIYEKTGRMKFVSHLDMNRYIPRLIKIAGVPIWFTEGFNQHAYITFALPLSLGVTSSYDVFDMKITDDSYTNEMVKDALNSKAAEGIKVLDVVNPFCNASEIAFASYTVKIEDTHDCLNAFFEFMNKDSILAEKKVKKGRDKVMKTVDIAQVINEKSIVIENGELTLKLVIPAGNGGSINPMLYIKTFEKEFGRKIDLVLINRDMLYTAKKEIFR